MPFDQPDIPDHIQRFKQMLAAGDLSHEPKVYAGRELAEAAKAFPEVTNAGWLRWSDWAGLQESCVLAGRRARDEER